MEGIAKQFGLDLNGAWNKAAMPHLGRHPNAYHNFVLKGMQDAAAGAEEMWKRLSATWAKGVPNGSTVPVFLNNPRAGSIWFQTELPILQSKGVHLLYK